MKNLLVSTLEKNILIFRKLPKMNKKIYIMENNNAKNLNFIDTYISIIKCLLFNIKL